MKKLIVRIFVASFGLFVNGIGLYFTIQANIGLAPWDVLTSAIALRTGISYGNISMIIGFLILFVDLAMKEPVGFGMILDALIVGKTVDLLQWTGWLPSQSRLLGGIVCMIIGMFFIALSQWIYMPAALGCGPRDALLVALGKRMRKLPIGFVQFMMLAVVLAAGWLLGGSVGIGTVMAVFGIGAMMQLIFSVVRFEPRSVTHENVTESIKTAMEKP